MKSNVFGYDQTLCMDFDLSPKDLLILDFIVDFYSSAVQNEVELVIKDGKMYCWIERVLILNQLPILMLKDRGLENRINNLIMVGLLERVHQYKGKRKASYYKPTPLLLKIKGYDTNVELVKQQEAITTNETKKTIQYERLVNLYHQLCPNLPKVKTITRQRQVALKKFIDAYGEERYQELLVKVANSNHLNGINDNNWKADFDWILNSTTKRDTPTNILEGKYDNERFAWKNKKNTNTQASVIDDDFSF